MPREFRMNTMLDVQSHSEFSAKKSSKATPKKNANARTRPAASDEVRGEWLRRVEAEYHSAAITQHVTLWLMQMGASPDLIHLGLRIVSDELAHADLSHRAFLAAGGTDVPKLARETLELPRHAVEPLECDVARTCVEVFCLGETVAVPLFKELRDGCNVPAARRVLDRVLRDEVRHRDFGWTLLPYLLETPLGTILRGIIERELPYFFARLKEAYAPDVMRAQTEISESDRAWGLIAPARYADILDRTLERDWIPRFGHLGFDARAAWMLETR